MDIMERIARHERGEERLVVYGADLAGANLAGANLAGAYLAGAYLTGANLAGAYLRGADLRGADLTDAVLADAVLRGAKLTGAYLTGANLAGAYLTDADLTGAKLDYASWTWSCRTLGVKTDDKQSRQQCYHWLANNLRHLRAAGFPNAELQRLLGYANGFHRVLSGDVPPLTLEE